MVQKLSMKLQLFGLGQVSRPFLNADTGANAGGSPTGGADLSNNQNQEGAQKSFDDILKESDYQAQYDQRLAAAIEAKRTEWEANSQNKIEEALTEAEKVAKMTKEQKEKYEFDKQKEALEAREAEMNRRELKATGIDKLREDNLPVGLIDVMNLSDAESFNKSYETVKEIFKTELEAAVNEKLRGTNMPTSSSSGATATTGFGFSFTGVRNKK